MTFEGNFRQRQSSDEWQEGVRHENRLRRMEERIEELNRLCWWMVIGYVSGIAVLITVLLLHH